MYALTNDNTIRSGADVIPKDLNNRDYQAYLAWLAAGNVPTPAPAIAAQPNINGFIAAVKTGMGGIVAANALMKSYPAFANAVYQAQWADVAALIVDAKATAVITAGQYAAFQAAAVANNIPVALP